MSSMFVLFHVQLYLTELNVTMLVISVLRKTFFFTGLCTVLWKTKPFLTSYIGIKRVSSSQVLLIECIWLIISKCETTITVNVLSLLVWSVLTQCQTGNHCCCCPSIWERLYSQFQTSLFFYKEKDYSWVKTFRTVGSLPSSFLCHELRDW